MSYKICPRCGFKALEKLSTHQHCVSCNYSPTLDPFVHPHLGLA